MSKPSRSNLKNQNILRRAARTTISVTLCTAILTQLGPQASAQPTTAPTSQPATQPTSQANGNGKLITAAPGGLLLNFKDAPIDSVLDELSKVGGFIIVKVVKPTGRITLTSRQPVTPKDAISLLNTVMKDAGYAAIQQGRIIKIVAVADAMHSSIPVRNITSPDQIDPTDELITAVIPLRQADAMQLKQDLSPLVNPSADFTANQSSNALLITDTQANIRRVVEIVSSLDKNLVDSAEYRPFRLQYASATAAATLINQLFAQQGGGGGGGGGGGNPFQRFF